MSPAASDYVFVVCVVVLTSLSALGGGSGTDRWLAFAQSAGSTLLTLLVLLRVGIFGLSVMFVTVSLLQRVPMTFDSASLYAAGSWVALAIVLGAAAGGFILATRGTPRMRTA